MPLDYTNKTRLAPVLILKTLERHSSRYHRLTQKEIIKHLEEDYDFSPDRKSVGRNLHLLKEADFGVKLSAREGSYLEKVDSLSDAQVKVVMDHLRNSDYLSSEQAGSIAGKLTSGNCVIKMNPVCEDTLDIASVFIDAEKLHKQVSFIHASCSEYEEIVSGTAVNMYFHKNRYIVSIYLETEQVVKHYPLEHIKRMRLTDKPAVHVRNMKDTEVKLSSPMRSIDEAPVMVSVLAESDGVRKIREELREDIFSEIKLDNGKSKLLVKASESCMVKYAVKHPDLIEVTAPESVRQSIKQHFENAYFKYAS